MLNIETVKGLPAKEIAKAIRNNEVDTYIIEIIAYNKKQPTRKFYNPEVYKAILCTSPEENLAVTILEKLMNKKKVDLLDFMYFLNNKNIRSEYFNFYLLEATIKDEKILKIINQADPRIEDKFLKEIIEKGFEKAEILLNKNLSKEDFVKCNPEIHQYAK